MHQRAAGETWSMSSTIPKVRQDMRFPVVYQQTVCKLQPVFTASVQSVRFSSYCTKPTIKCYFYSAVVLLYNQMPKDSKSLLRAQYRVFFLFLEFAVKTILINHINTPS